MIHIEIIFDDMIYELFKFYLGKSHTTSLYMVLGVACKVIFLTESIFFILIFFDFFFIFFFLCCRWQLGWFKDLSGNGKCHLYCGCCCCIHLLLWCFVNLKRIKGERKISIKFTKTIFYNFIYIFGFFFSFFSFLLVRTGWSGCAYFDGTILLFSINEQQCFHCSNLSCCPIHPV